jgi:predicted Zn-dependent protease
MPTPKLNKSVLIYCLALLMLVSSCSTVDITGRKRFNIMPESYLNSMALTEYQKFIEASTLSTNASQSAMVERVGRRIADAVNRYYRQRDSQHPVLSYNWEFNLVDDPNVNAWAMPGGKVVVYTGLLPVAVDETGLAVVMGHEIAHALVGHGAERMSQQLVFTFGGIAVDQAMQEQPEQTRAIVLSTYGVGAQLGILKYSRTHESEADHLGLIYMAMAGYDPEAAVTFWQRMADAKGGGAPPEFLSTHPSDATRIRDIKRLLPEVRAYYRPAN